VSDGERAGLLRRRRRARLAGVAGAVVVVLALALVATPAPPPGAEEVLPEPAAAVRLPRGCERRAPAASPRPRVGRAPSLELRPGRDYRALIRTSCGDISIDLLESRAPANVANFVALARRGFYDGLRWHRVERDSVIQTGDPNNQNLVPPDGPGYQIPDELWGVRGRDYVYGVVGMANAGPDTAGSQFFIVVHDHEGALKGAPEPAGLQPDYSIFGRVDRSAWETLQRLSAVPTKGGLDLVEAVEPVLPIYVDSIEIEVR
jgi:cyclophilin family peptidyl-prolyl cis-trans isomerase